MVIRTFYGLPPHAKQTRLSPRQLTDHLAIALIDSCDIQQQIALLIASRHLMHTAHTSS